MPHPLEPNSYVACQSTEPKLALISIQKNMTNFSRKGNTLNSHQFTNSNVQSLHKIKQQSTFKQSNPVLRLVQLLLVHLSV